MKQLPKLYKNENIKLKNNNKENCYVKELLVNNKETKDQINSIFNTRGFPFDKRVLIKTKDKTYKTYLVSKDEQTVKTLKDEIINIEDIISIERIN